MSTSVQSLQVSNIQSSTPVLNRKSFTPSSTEPSSPIIDTPRVQIPTEQRVNPPAEQSAVNKEQLNQKIKDLGSLLSNKELDLQFSVDETTGEDIVKFVDRSNKEVIQQIPSEQMLKVIQSIGEFLDKYQKKTPVGVMVNERA